MLLNYEGTLNDVSTLAHELGHSMHTYFSCHNNESFDMPIDELIKKCGDRIKFSPGKEPYITYKLKDQSKTLEEIKDFLKI